MLNETHPGLSSVSRYNVCVDESRLSAIKQQLTRGLVLFTVIVLTSCGILGGGLDKRAALYYNFMVGRKPNVTYNRFLSPAYRNLFAPEELAKLDTAMQQGRTPNERLPSATASDVYISQAGTFALTTVNPKLDKIFAAFAPVRWVRVGGRWYLYSGSDAEYEAYGPFPQDLVPPQPPAETE